MPHDAELTAQSSGRIGKKNLQSEAAGAVGAAAGRHAAYRAVA